MRRLIPVVVLLTMLPGCASLKPEQSARLNEAQKFVDGVTVAYGVPSPRGDRRQPRTGGVLRGHAAVSERRRNDWTLGTGFSRRAQQPTTRAEARAKPEPRDLRGRPLVLAAEPGALGRVLFPQPGVALCRAPRWRSEPGSP